MRQWRLLLLLAAAALLRFVGLDWDAGLLFHPDERNLVEAASRLGLSELRDPGFYAYNGLTLYVDRLLAALVAAASGDPTLATDPVTLARVGRFVSALASTATVALLFGLTREALGRRAAWLAAALFAFAPGSIQAAHFATTESVLVMLGVGCAWASLRLATGPVPSWSSLGVAALCVGLAVGTKTSGLALLAMPATALALRLPRAPLRLAGLAAAGLVGAALVAASVSPHSILAFDAFWASMQAERAVATGSHEVFYTLSFRGTTPYLHQLGSLHWLAGPLVPGLGLAGWAGLLLGGRTPPGRALLPLVVFCVAYAAYVGSWHAKFVRYLLPLLPGLAIGAAFVAERWSRARRAVSIALLATSVLSGVALFGIYLRPDPRLAASRWLAAQASPQDVLALESRDVVLPLARAAGTRGLGAVWLDGLAPDSEAGLVRASQALSAADWLVLTSRRVHGVTRANPEVFPRTSALYRQLFDGGLGYELAGRFESQPGIARLRWPDDAAEETFRVFDHPTVHVFRNRHRWAPSEIRRAVEREAGLEPAP